MSRGSGRPTDANGDAFPFWDEPERRRRRGKKHNESYRKSGDGVRSRRPRPEDDTDLTDLDDDEADDFDGEEDWQSRDDR